MDFRGASPVFFATDLTNFLACRHLTAVERLAAHKLAKRPYFDDPMLELLRQRGLEHERAYVDSLRPGARVVEISRNAPDAFDATLRAMRDGADVVVQAKLEHGRWAGWADVLLRRPGESSFGGWHYEPVETKLAVETRGATLLQLCLYADLLTELQGTAPSELHVVTPASTERYRFEEFRAYFRLLRRRFELELQTPLPTSVETATPYPDPVSHCDVCNWYGVCEKRRAADDHLSLVAGIQKTQRTELSQRGIATLAALATMPLPLAWKPSRGSVGALERAREQARLQFQARTSGTPTYELLPVEIDHGLAALPVPSSLDVFLDLEGDRQADGGGFEYLFGYAFRGADGAVRYESLWALSPDEEKLAFERFIDMVTGWRAVDWSMHVYHYAPYEPTAMKRLMGRYATRAEELDRLLRAKAFVDLYSVVRKGIRAGVDSYSIKRLEPFYGLVREVDLRVASRHLRALEYALAKKNTGSLTSEIREAVRSYNRDDCVSALQLRDWLETLRVEAEAASGEPIPRPARPARMKNEKLSERLARIRRIADALTAGLPSERDQTQQARWILAQLLEWHRREDKVDWWEFHRMNDMSDDELLDERAGIAGLEFERRLETTKRGSVIDRYVFPRQDTDFDDQDDAYELGCEKPSPFAKVDAIDIDRRTLDLRKSGARADQHPRALFKQDKVANPDAVNALMRLGEFVRDHGIDDGGQHRAARDLLLRLNPRLAAGQSLRMAGESTVQSARRAVLALEGGVLAIQGPPGAGKTFTGARMIVDLVRSGRKVGVTAVSHKVIRNLLEEVVLAAAEEGTVVRCVHRVSEKSRLAPSGIEEETDSARALKRIANREYDVVGGTAWVWAKQDVEEALDVLVVDEAGQMSLANVIACAQAAKNLVLLGDPQQLEQPQKASHPEGSELSALEYLLEGHETMPEDRGLFLGETWRLHPAICSYTSDLFYESKLRSHAGLDAQLVAGPTRFAGAGLFHVAVEHEGNQNTSIEEAVTVAELVTELTMTGVTWTDRHGVARPVTLDEILIVAPYNAQVSEIAERIPGARVGTVDKFQGQEAPIVIYSMATSSPEEAPHGMEFLFSRHRLNVATSRARCVCILIGNPRLFEPECRTPEQIRLANAFCAYLERARIIDGKRTENGAGI